MSLGNARARVRDKRQKVYSRALFVSTHLKLNQLRQGERVGRNITIMNVEARFCLWSIFLSFLSISGFAASPDDGDNFYVYTRGATKAVVYSLDNLDKLTFNDKSMSVWTNVGRTDYAYGDISLLTFCEEVKPASVVDMFTDSNDIRISYNRETMQVSVQSAKPLTGLFAFDMQGRTVGSLRKTGDSLQLSLLGLPQGVYIVKTQGANFEKSVKIIK